MNQSPDKSVNFRQRRLIDDEAENFFVGRS